MMSSSRRAASSSAAAKQADKSLILINRSPSSSKIRNSSRGRKPLADLNNNSNNNNNNGHCGSPVSFFAETPSPKGCFSFLLPNPGNNRNPPSPEEEEEAIPTTTMISKSQLTVSTPPIEESQKSTPPVEASISPEIHYTTTISQISGEIPATAVCFAAGHVISKVGDRRKCKPKGLLTVEPATLGFFDSSSLSKNVAPELEEAAPPIGASIQWWPLASASLPQSPIKENPRRQDKKGGNKESFDFGLPATARDDSKLGFDYGSKDMIFARRTGHTGNNCYYRPENELNDGKYEIAGVSQPPVVGDIDEEKQPACSFDPSHTPPLDASTFRYAPSNGTSSAESLRLSNGSNSYYKQLKKSQTNYSCYDKSRVRHPRSDNYDMVELTPPSCSSGASSYLGRSSNVMCTPSSGSARRHREFNLSSSDSGGSGFSGTVALSCRRKFRGYSDSEEKSDDIQEGCVLGSGSDFEGRRKLKELYDEGTRLRSPLYDRMSNTRISWRDGLISRIYEMDHHEFDERRGSKLNVPAGIGNAEELNIMSFSCSPAELTERQGASFDVHREISHAEAVPTKCGFGSFELLVGNDAISSEGGERLHNSDWTCSCKNQLFEES